jgi:flagellar motor switch protein FliM
MVFEVEMWAFMNGQIREVHIDDERLEGKTKDQVLELVFHFGQNDVQPKDMCSVSVGDVIRLDGVCHEVKMFGFEKKVLDNKVPNL